MRPMLAKTGNKNILSSDDYIFEPKLDGYRALCFSDKKNKFVSRNGIDLTKKYPELSFSLPKDSIFDGEIVVYDENGNPSFQLLQDSSEKATYVIFDIIQLNGEYVAELPLIERKKLLHKNVKPGENLQLMVFTDDGKKLFDVMKKRNLEGVVAKRKDSMYNPDVRSDDWLKIKIFKTTECAIVGYLTKNRDVSSLALALYDEKKYVYVGQVGSGFNEKTLKEISKILQKAEVKDNGVHGMQKGVKPVKIKYVCEVRFVEFSRDRQLRSSVFLRLRDDKNPEECTFNPENIPKNTA